MGIVDQPLLMDYWSQSTLTRTPDIAAVMTRTRFLQILHYLHFVDNESEVANINYQRTVLIMTNSIKSETCRMSLEETFKEHSY